MSRASLLRHRVAARRGLLLLVWLLVVGLAASLGVTVGYVRTAGVESARDGLAAAAPQGRGVLLMTRLADGEAAVEQDRRVLAAVGERLGPTPYTLYRETRTEPLPVTVDGVPTTERWVVSTPELLRTGSSRDPADRDGATELAGTWDMIDREVADTTQGSWPRADSGGTPEAAVHEAAARAAGIEVGDTITLGARPDEPGSGTRVTVSGLWRVTDGERPRWFADPVVTTGSDGEARGPILVADDVLTEMDTTPFARWLVTPDADRITPTDLERTTTLAEDLDTTLADDDAVAIRGFQALGTYGDTARAVSTRIGAAEAVSLVAVILLALAGLVALVQVTRLVAAVREGEVTLLVSRGADARTVLAAAIWESVALALTACAVGAGLAAAVLHRIDPGQAQWPLLSVTAGVVAVVTTTVAAVVTGTQARAAIRRRITDRSGRMRQAAAAGTVVLVLVAAAVCAWQFALRGSPLVTTPTGAHIDPPAAAAPALLLAAAAVLATAVLGPATRVWARLAAEIRDAGPVLAARQVTRRLVVYVVPVVLLALAAGAATLAGAYAGTARTLSDEVSVLRNGTDVRVRLPAGQVGDPAAGAAYADIDGTSSAPVFTGDAVAAETPFTLVAAPAADLPRVMRTSPGVADVGRIADALTTAHEPDGPELPVVMTEQLAATLDLTEDDQFELSYRGSRAPARIVATTAVVPGVLERNVVLVDADAMAAWREGDDAVPLPADEIWLTAEDPAAPPAGPGDRAAPAHVGDIAAAAREIAAAHPGEAATVTTTHDTADSAASVRVVFWLAAVGTGALALLGVAVAAVALLRDRRGEVIVLRAVGLSPTTQARVRATELIVVGGAAVALGALAGWGVARFTAGALANATLTGVDVELPARFVLDVPTTATVLAAEGVGLVAVAVVVGTAVAAQVRDTTYREEVR